MFFLETFYYKIVIFYFLNKLFLSSWLRTERGMETFLTKNGTRGWNHYSTKNTKNGTEQDDCSSAKNWTELNGTGRSETELLKKRNENGTISKKPERAGRRRNFKFHSINSVWFLHYFFKQEMRTSLLKWNPQTNSLSKQNMGIYFILDQTTFSG